VVSGDYKPFASPGLLMFCSSDTGTDQESEAIQTLVRVALHLVRRTPGLKSVVLPFEQCLTNVIGDLPSERPLNLDRARSSTNETRLPASIHIDRCERERKAIMAALRNERATSIRVLLCHFHVLSAWEENLLSKFEDCGPRDELRACMKVALTARVCAD
jgi:hypothetical protein